MRRYAFSKQALNNIDEAVAYIAVDDAETAKRFTRAVLHACEMIADTPKMGSPIRLRHTALSNMRMLPVRGFNKHLIFYRPTSIHGLEIIRILHSARDFPRFFS